MQFATAVFVGAGCSKNFGYPLTNDLLPEALRRVTNSKPVTETKRGLFRGINSLPTERKDEQFFLAALKRLLPGLQQQIVANRKCGSRFSISITDVLSLIDHSLLSGHHFGRRQSTDELRRLRRLVERAMFEVLYDDGEYSDPQWVMLERFIRRIHAEARRKGRVALISTNYDLALEFPLFEPYEGSDGWADEARVAGAFDFGLNWRSPYDDQIYLRPKNPKWGLYKLHGSFNWLRCPVCEHIYVNVDASIAFQAYRRGIDENNSCDCGYGPLATHLVAPSLVRDIRDPNLLDIWKHSQEVLRRAATWYVIGYSFPTEDIAIRSMFLRAYHSRATKPNVIVIQKSDESRDRYRLFFPDCDYRVEGWESFLRSEV